MHHLLSSISCLKKHNVKIRPELCLQLAIGESCEVHHRNGRAQRNVTLIDCPTWQDHHFANDGALETLGERYVQIKMKVGLGSPLFPNPEIWK